MTTAAAPPPAPFLAALEAVTGALAASGLAHALMGGLAAVAHGVPRATLDIDVTVALGTCDVAELMEGLTRHGLRPRHADAVAFARRHQTLLMRH